MLVSDIFARLSRGPLSNLAIGMDGVGTIQEDKIPTLIDYLNQGLTHLYTRFVLNEKQLLVVQDDLTTIYKLVSTNAVSNGGAVQFIQDSVDAPFTNDLLKILGVFDEIGREYPMNDEGAHNSLFTPRIDTIQVPEPITGQPMFVLYQASHPGFDPTNPTVVLTQDIDLPQVLAEALINWIASQVFDSMNGQEHQLRAKSLMGKYEAICGEAEQKDMLNTSVSKTSSKFVVRGFC